MKDCSFGLMDSAFFLSNLIKEMTVFKSTEGDWPHLKEAADRVFRTIADYPNPVDLS
jgi:hypothetical protein